jgi:formyl-CoA transferase
MSLNGSPDGGPVRCATYLGDDLAGLHGALAALAALRHRDATGEGQHIDVSLMDSILFQSNGYLTLGAIGHPMPRIGNRSLFSAPVDAFECADGHVFLAVLLEPHWRALTKIIGRPDMVSDPRFATMAARHQHRDQTDAAVAAWMKTQSVADVEREFAKAGIPAAAVRTYAEAAANPHVIERDMLQPIEQEDGKTVPLTGPAAKFSRTPIRVRTRAARLGEHTEEILEELGIGAAERNSLRAMKII